jgi:hypothetical protein
MSAEAVSAPADARHPVARDRAGRGTARSEGRGAVSGIHARVGDPCPNGCTEGIRPHKKPVLIRYALYEPGSVEGPDGTLLPTDGEMYCPHCGDYMGNDRSTAAESDLEAER